MRPNDNATLGTDLKRRRALKLIGAGTTLSTLSALAAEGSAAKVASAKAMAKQPPVVVVGGGFGGSTVARTLKTLSPQTDVVLVERKRVYTACPFSNLVVAGQRNISKQEFNWQGLERIGVRVVTANVIGVDTRRQRLRLHDSTSVDYSRLVLAPGIQLRFDAIEGYTHESSIALPHAWQAGSQTLLLRAQLQQMPNGGLVVIAVPQNPYRCPPGPYERASLIAHYLKTRKPRSKLLILDAKERFSKMALFRNAWQSLYGDLIEWRGLSESGAVRRVDARAKTLHTDFDSVTADVANVIPPQQAGAIAQLAGVTDASGWCPINPQTFESSKAANVHVIGDAAIANAMPKSAFAANAQAKVCAAQIDRSLAGQPPVETTLINTCYSLVAPKYGISVAGVYRPGERFLQELPGAGGTSPLEASRSDRRLEAAYARGWFKTITQETFG